jgi:hypothetical protein
LVCLFEKYSEAFFIFAINLNLAYSVVIISLLLKEAIWNRTCKNSSRLKTKSTRKSKKHSLPSKFYPDIVSQSLYLSQVMQSVLMNDVRNNLLKSIKEQAERDLAQHRIDEQAKYEQ